MQLDDWEASYMLQSEDVEAYVRDPQHGPKKLLKGPFPLLEREIRKHGARSVLDVGCNLGYLYDWLQYRRLDVEYTGVDIDLHMVNRATQLHDAVPRFEHANLFTMGDEYRADIVFCSRVLIHLPRSVEAINRLRALANKAVILVLKLGESELCERVETEHGFHYMHTITRDMIPESCTVHDFGCYSTVVCSEGGLQECN